MVLGEKHGTNYLPYTYLPFTVKESNQQNQNKLQAFCKHRKREAPFYKASRCF